MKLDVSGADESVGGSEESEQVERGQRETGTPEMNVRQMIRLGLLYATLSDHGKAMIGESILSRVDSSNHPFIAAVSELVTGQSLSVRELFETKAVRKAMGVHRHNNVSWFRKENAEQLLPVLYYIDGLGQIQRPGLPEEKTLKLLIEQSGYRYQDLIFY